MLLTDSERDETPVLPHHNDAQSQNPFDRAYKRARNIRMNPHAAYQRGPRETPLVSNPVLAGVSISTKGGSVGNADCEAFIADLERSSILSVPLISLFPPPWTPLITFIMDEKADLLAIKSVDTHLC